MDFSRFLERALSDLPLFETLAVHDDIVRRHWIVLRENRVYLTLLGGGAFGNRDDWIFAAIRRAISLFADAELDVSVVSYGGSKPRVKELVDCFLSSKD